MQAGIFSLENVVNKLGIISTIGTLAFATPFADGYTSELSNLGIIAAANQNSCVEAYQQGQQKISIASYHPKNLATAVNNLGQSFAAISWTNKYCQK